ncbi:hypothetical protein BC937DRAFT_86160 [Endogone sp. FLAS-F59071]|nr:hypothetical protein BC937DRAFT_86160 [Endogone sp. FLAS-F59071]|eukprot:RUS22866.1 hypothetical protein BC937DRAFT_86160 [Endogone sp. FLAS-F59071]
MAGHWEPCADGLSGVIHTIEYTRGKQNRSLLSKAAVVRISNNVHVLRAKETNNQIIDINIPKELNLLQFVFSEVIENKTA